MTSERAQQMTAIVREVRETLFAIGRAEVVQATLGKGHRQVATDDGLAEAEAVDAAAARLDELVRGYVVDVVTAVLAERLAPPPTLPTPDLVTQARQKAVAQAAAAGATPLLFPTPEAAVAAFKGSPVPYGGGYVLVRGRAVAEVERVTARVEVLCDECVRSIWYPVLISG